MNDLRISPSNFCQFERCSKSFLWQYIEQVPFDKGADNIYAIFGTSFHKVMELRDKYSLKLEDCISGWKLLFLHFFSEAKYLEKKDYDLKDKQLKLGEHFVRNAFLMIERWKDYENIANEKYVKVKFENKFLDNVYLSGKIDLILKKLDTYVCFDWKTSKSKEKDIDSNIQLSFYIYYLSIIVGNDLFDKFYGALGYPFDKEIIFTQRTKEDINILFEKINKMVERIKNGDFKKEPLINFCPDDCCFCPYKVRCKNVD
jgi:CRISPR/Cas system-associated exonuclease Cas4 (RecB family)